MANTPRAGDAHIVIGVAAGTDGRHTVVGVAEHPDEANLRTVLQVIHPAPDFTYHVVPFDGVQVAVIAIHPSRTGPFRPLRDLDNGRTLRASTIYFRRGSQNTQAEPEDLVRILQWFGSIDGRAAQASHPWEEIEPALSDFDPARAYFLIAGPVPQDDLPHLTGLARAPWTAVLDFDPMSQSSGLLSRLEAEVRSRRSLRLVTTEESRAEVPPGVTEWVFARGIDGRETTLTSTWRDWRRSHAPRLEAHVRRLAATAAPSPVTVLVLWPSVLETTYLRTALEQAIAAFDAPDLIVVGHEHDLRAVAEGVDAVVADIPLAQLAAGIASIASQREELPDSEMTLPSSSGAPVGIAADDARWLAEELSLVDLRAGTDAVDVIGRFLRGSQISWSELAVNEDVERDQTERAFRQIRDQLETRAAGRVNIYHAPGAGGTTIARRVAWDLHREYPTALLQRTEPAETVGRLARVIALTGLPLLLLVDGAEVTSGEIDHLFDLIRSRSLPVVIVQVLRRFRPQQAGSRVFFVPAELTPAEGNRFVFRYRRVMPDKAVALEELASCEGSRRTAFHFALTAFERDFLGLEPFVRARLEQLNDNGRRILTSIAISHHYGQRPLPAQAFAQMLGLPPNRSVDLRAALPDEAFSLLLESEPGQWRTTHEIVAAEALEQLLSHPHSDRRIWRQRLSVEATAFAELCRGTAPVPSSQLLDLARRVFIYRDNTELLGTERAGTRQFAQLVEDIPSDEGKLAVLEAISALWPDEAHMWAHLGRFHSFRGDDIAADEALRRALELDDTDPVLFHMRGMALRNQVYRGIESRADLSALVSIAENATGSFTRCRERDPDGEHGYISEAQMLLRLLDYAVRDRPDGVAGLMASANIEPYLREAVDSIESMLGIVRRSRGNQPPSQYEETCRASLEQLYGNHGRSLEVLGNLLGRRDVYAPPVRRSIAYVLLARRGSFEQMPRQEIQRVVSLLEENQAEEPNSDRNMLLWLRSARWSATPPTLDQAIEKVSYWRAARESNDAYFYLYVLHGLQAIEGSRLARDPALAFLEESRAKARWRRTRHNSIEWLGEGRGLSRLVHQGSLGDWDEERGFWERTDNLARVHGRIARIEGPQAGTIEIEGGLNAFFAPGRGSFARGKSENELVTCYLGFSYDGPRAWSVQPAE